MTSFANQDQSFVLDSELVNEQSQNYDVVSFNLRLKLVKLVCDQGYLINRAAKVLGINDSTAKYIICTFKKNGKILKKLNKNQVLTEDLIKQYQELSQKYAKKQQQRKEENQKSSNTKRSKKLKNRRSKKVKTDIPTSQKQQKIAPTSFEILEDGIDNKIVWVPYVFDYPLSWYCTYLV